MLSLAGTLCRILYEHEMAQIARVYNKMISDTKTNTKTITKTNTNTNTKTNTKTNSKTNTKTNTKADTKADTEADTKTDKEGFHESIDRRATHALTHFMFRRSTPNEKVGKISESQFFECSKKPVSILSTNGVLPISNVRIPNPEMKGFLKTVPVVSTITFEKCNLFFMKAKDSFKLIEELSLKDVLFELKSRTLSEVELVELLKWWISCRSKGNKIDPSEHKQFMQLAHIGSKSRSLDTICYFLNPSIVPPNMDVPVEVLPHTISKNFKNQDLEKCLNWSELPLVNWARFIVNKSDLEVDLAFAEKVHCILAKGLNNTSQNDKETIRKLFAQKKCIPTKFGMKVPNEAYFQNVNLFPDLPTIQFQKPSNVQNIMELLGVRKVKTCFLSFWNIKLLIVNPLFIGC